MSHHCSRARLWLIAALAAVSSAMALPGAASAATTPDDAPPAKVFYAAPAGRGPACSPGDPCALTTAQQRARKYDRHGMHRDTIVQLADGTYRLTTPLIFTAADSGTNGYSVTYQVAPGAHPVISGGQQVTGWQLTDPAKNIWSAPVPSSLRTRQLYINGARVPRASGPPPVTLTQTATGFIASSAVMASWRNPSNIEFVFKGGHGAWTEPRCDVAGISGTTITMRQPCWDNMHWSSAPQHTVPDGDNPQGGFPGLSPRAVPTSIENAYELLSPGHWYLDQSAHQIDYIPTPGQDLSAADVEAPVLQTLVRGAGTLDDPVHNLTFRGIQFSYATWLRPSGDDGFSEMQANFTLTGPDASTEQGLCNYTYQPPPGTCPFAAWTKTPANVTFRAAHDVTFDGDVFSHLGGAGLGFDYGSQHNLIRGNEFTDISGSGIELGNTTDPLPKDVGADSREINDGNTIIDNYIHDTAAEYHGGVGIWVGYTRHTLIAHNQIDDQPYSGISMGWGGWHTNSRYPNTQPSIIGDNVIKDNLIFHHMQYLRDGGAIYTNGPQGTSFDQGLTISGNVAYDDNTNNEYYDDEGGAYVTLTSNVEYRAGGNSTGGCSTTGHIRIHGNYFAQPGPGFGCSPPAVYVQYSNNHPISNHPSPSEIPTSILAAAGLEPPYRHLITTDPPVTSGVGPASGPADGGTRVLVSGSGFTPATTVSFGSQPASHITVLSANYLIATAPASSGARTVDVTVTTPAGTSPTTADRYTYQLPYPSLSAAYDNIGITDDTNTDVGNVDGFGSSFSSQALASLGVTPGATLIHDGATFIWPDVPAGTDDNALAAGQIINLTGSGSTLGILATSIYPTSSTGTVVYTDGSRQSYQLTFPNWYGSAPAGTDVAIAAPYRNRPGNVQDHHIANVFGAAVPLQPGKTVSQVILPDVGGGVGVGVPSLHVWSVAIQ